MSQHSMFSPPVDVLMAVYIPRNMPEVVGYLDHQVQSILHQNYDGPIRILIRDDGSDFDVQDIILNRNLPPHRKIEFLTDLDGNLGYVRNFERLMEASTAPFVCLTDQDDECHPDRIRISVQKLVQMEQATDPHIASLVFCDACFCDESLEVIHPSMNQALERRFEKAVFDGVSEGADVYGFSMVLNRPLVDASLPIRASSIAEGGIGHDGYILKRLKEIGGNVHFIDKPLAMYRRHDANVSAAEL